MNIVITEAKSDGSTGKEWGEGPRFSSNGWGFSGGLRRRIPSGREPRVDGGSWLTRLFGDVNILTPFNGGARPAVGTAVATKANSGQIQKNI